MSRESRQQRQEETRRQEVRLANRRKLSQILPVVGVVFAVAGALAAIHFYSQKSKPSAAPVAVVQSPSFKLPEKLAQLLDLSPADLEKVDIARMNLLCAEDLPGAENLKVNDDLATLNS